MRLSLGKLAKDKQLQLVEPIPAYGTEARKLKKKVKRKTL